MLVKICGITNINDAANAVDAGADALGLVFCEGSKRKVSINSAQEICQVIPVFTSKVGLFMNQSALEINKILEQVPINILQFHGDEGFEFCESFSRPYIKVFNPKKLANKTDFNLPFFSSSLMTAYLLDAGAGDGKVFDWQAFVQENVDIHKNIKPIILAGGLNCDNVRQAITLIKPDGVDTSSGVESSIVPPAKDKVKMSTFVKEAKNIK